MSPVPSSLFDKTARWFERARAALLDDLPCQKGCTRCCVGLFPVTRLDQAELQRGLHSLAPHERDAIQTAAARQAELITISAPELAYDRFIDHLPDRAIDRLVQEFGDLPCPVLQPDGSCGLYAFRPLTCRSMGIPPEVDGMVQGACEIQTFVPVRRLSPALRAEEDALAQAEADALERGHTATGGPGEELFLPFAILPDSNQ